MNEIYTMEDVLESEKCSLRRCYLGNLLKEGKGGSLHRSGAKVTRSGLE